MHHLPFGFTHPLKLAAALAVLLASSAPTARADSWESALARYGVNGALDTTFRGTGKYLSTTPGIDEVNAVAISGSRTVTAGYYMSKTGSSVDHKTLILTEIDGAGAPITTFGYLGVSVIDVPSSDGLDDVPTAVAFDSLSQVLVGGFTSGANGNVFRPFLSRLTSAGRLDKNFGNSGFAPSPVPDYGVITDVKSAASNKTVVTGHFYINQTTPMMFVARYTEAGQLDPTFNQTGYRLLGYSGGYATYGGKLLLDSNGGITVSGTVFNPSAGRSSPVVFQLDYKGVSNPNFAKGYPQPIEISFGPQASGGSLVFDARGGILLMGNASDALTTKAFLLRLRADGTTDPSFAGTGYYFLSPPTATNPVALAMALDKDGGLYLLAGDQAQSHTYLAHVFLRTTGAVDLDPGFDTDGWQTVALSPNRTTLRALAIQDGLKPLVAGSYLP